MSKVPLWKKLPKHSGSFLLMLLFLAVPAIHEIEYAWIDDPCALRESEQGYATDFVYLSLADWTFRFRNSHPNLFRNQQATETPILIVYIDPETDPPALLTNTCLARDFLAALVKDITDQGAKGIVIDKFYSEGSCSNEDTNKGFREALNESAARIPIVVGQPTTLLRKSDRVEGKCLALLKRFDFGSDSVKYGLTRLNSDVLKIPLRWPVSPEDPKDVLPPEESGDSLSTVAAEQIDPSFNDKNLSFQKFLALKKHPYTSFLELPSTTATAVRCAMGTSPPVDPNAKKLDCEKARNRPDGRPDLRGKVVVIGDRSDQDMQPFPDSKLRAQEGFHPDSKEEPKKERPGVFLQANYVKSILDQRFLREIPFFVTVIGFLLFIIAVYCLHWLIKERRHASSAGLSKRALWAGHSKHASQEPKHASPASPPKHNFLLNFFLDLAPPEKALAISVIALMVIMAVSLVALFGFRYYTPIWAISGAFLFIVLRYLETKAHHYAEIGKESHHSTE